jgi:hypothetical protein
MAAQRPSSPHRTARPHGPTPAGTGRRHRLAATGQVAGRRALGAAVGVAALARAAGGRLLAAARGETGRRLARAVTLSVALAVLITTLYDRGETPRAAAQPAVAAPAAGAVGGAATRARTGAPGGNAGGPDRTGGAGRQDPGEVGGRRGRPRPPAVGERPAAVAAAWYAARQGVPATKVEALQQDRVSAREVRVLVLADHGHGRLRTALVTVRLGPAGWSVR